MKTVLTTALALVVSTPVYAQTAEETVLYFMSGFEGIERSVSPDPQGSLSIRPVQNLKNGYILNMYFYGNKNEPSFKIDYATFILDKVSNCVYNLHGKIIKEEDETKNGAQPSIDISIDYDFSKSTSITWGSQRDFNVSFIGGVIESCKNDASGKNCAIFHNVSPLFRINFGEKDRVEKAFAYFKKQYCAGSAF